MKLHALLLATLAATGVTAAQSPRIVLSPTGLIFTQAPGSGKSPSQSVAITNGGGGTLSNLTRSITYTSPRVGTDGLDVNWLQTAFHNKVATAPTSLDVTTHATATLPPGTYTAQVSIRGKSASNSPVAFTVVLRVGNGPAVLGITPPALDFGSVGIGVTSPAQRLAITNTGFGRSGPLSPVPFATSFVGGANPGDFLVSATTCPSTGIPAGVTCTFDVAFRPQALGARTASFGFQASPGGTVSAGLTGTGTQTQFITFTPTPVDFGLVEVGVTSAPQTVTMTNTGSIATGALSVTNSLGDVLDFSGPVGPSTCLALAGGVLPAGASCTFSFTFTPTTRGPRSRSIEFSATPGGSAMLTLVGTGVPVPQAILALAPASHDFGAVGVGFDSPAATFTLTNIGTGPSGPLTIGGLGGADPGDFAGASPGTCGSVGGAGLAPGASCQFDLVFRPQALGPRSATFAIGASPGGTVSTALTGTGTQTQLITFTPTPLDFGLVEVGATSAPQTVTMTNTGSIATGALSVTNSVGDVLDFFGPAGPSTCLALAGAVLPAGASCTFSFTFTPTTKGPRSRGIEFSATPGGSAMLTLVGTGVPVPQAVLTLAPTSYDFGSVGVGIASPAATFTLTNIGTGPSGPLTIGGLQGANPGDFVGDAATTTCTSTGLAAGSSCTIGLAFVPQALGARSATLVIGAAPGGTLSTSLAGTGVASPQLLSVTPTSFDFGTVNVGVTSAPHRFTISNTGAVATGPFSTTGFQGADPGDFAGVFATSTCDDIAAVGLAAGASCDLDITFTPQLDVVRTAFVTFGATPGGTVTIQVSGTGIFSIPPPVLTLTPARIDFGLVPIYNSSPLRPFTVTNVSQAPVVLQGFSLAGPNATGFGLDPNGNPCLGVTLAPQQSCSFGVEYGPSVIGQSSATVTVTDFNGNTASAQAVAQATDQPMLAVTPGQFDFGSGVVGQTGPPMTFTVTNTAGAQSYMLTEFILLGPGASDFIFDPGTCDHAFPGPGQSCTISVSHKPLSVGARSATLTVSATNDLSGSWQGTVVLSGTGTPALAIAVTPAAYDFGSVTVGQTSAQVEFTMTNTGIVPTNAVLRFFYAGPGSAEYRPISGTCPVGLAPGASCTFFVSFSPQATGPRPMTLTVATEDASTNLATATVNLTGTGTTPVYLLTISPALYQFGGVLVGRTAGPATFTVTNSTSVRTGPIDGFSLVGTATADYAVSLDACAGATLDPGASCDFTVTFTPSVVGGHPVTLTVTTTQNESGATELRGFGLAPAVFTITPASYDFGWAYPGQGAGPVTFTVTNTGTGLSGVININSFSFSGPDAGEFSYFDTGTCFGPIQLPPGASCTMDLLFVPLALGPRTATFTVTAFGAGEGTGSATLTGGRTPGGVLTITPTAYDFGGIALGYFSLAGIFRVTNVGTTPAFLMGVEIQEPLLTNYFFEQGSYCRGGTFLDVGAGCDVIVRFEPQLLGPLPATLLLTYDAGKVSAALIGRGILDVLAFSPTSFDFGNRVVGSTGGVIPFTITNRGTTTTAPLDHVGITGDAAADFSVSNNLCAGVSLAPGGHCTVSVGFTPRALGLRFAAIMVGSDVDGSGGGAGLVGNGTAFSISAVNAAGDLLGVSALSAPERAFLDALGNHNGVYDLGDLLAFLDRNHLKVSPALLRGLARRTEGVR